MLGSVKAKTCNKCGQYKHSEEFYKNKSAKDGLYSYCKLCEKEARKKYWQSKKGKSVRSKAGKKYRASHDGKATQRKGHLRRRYNLTSSQHLSMYVNQNGCCAVCKRAIPYDKIHTDHNHVTGEVRGLLCPTCNLLVGHVENHLENLPTVLNYIETGRD